MSEALRKQFKKESFLKSTVNINRHWFVYNKWLEKKITKSNQQNKEKDKEVETWQKRADNATSVKIRSQEKQIKSLESQVEGLRGKSLNKLDEIIEVNTQLRVHLENGRVEEAKGKAERINDLCCKLYDIIESLKEKG